MLKGIKLTTAKDKGKIKDIGVSNQIIKKPLAPSEKETINNLIVSPKRFDASTVKKEDTKYFPKAQEERNINRNLIFRAPDEWNFFGQPDAETFHMLISSILEHGLINPITVWQQVDGRYMILSGHTRETAYDALYQVTQDEKYLSIPCRVYQYQDLTEVDARRIIILSNIAQRAKESKKDRIKSIGELAKLEKSKTSYGDNIDLGTLVANITGCSRTTVFFYKKVNNLIPPLLELFCNNKLTRRAADFLATLAPKLQLYIYNKKYYDSLTPIIIKALKQAKVFSTNDIDKIMGHVTNKDTPTKKYRYRVELHKTKPYNFKVIPVCVNNDDYLTIRKALANFIKNSDNITQSTKEYMLDELTYN